MATREIIEYYNATANREIRGDLRQAVELVDGYKVAIDCGCGAGRDIAFLRDNGFVVHGFDLERESIFRCKQRFAADEGVFLMQASFNSFVYPEASLVIADASLFFCPAREFDQVWLKISEALLPGGIFTGSFLGPRDTMTGPEYEKEAFWPDVLVFNEAQLRPIFKGFEIVKWNEHELDGQTAQGKPHHWHIYSVIARKNP